MNSKLEKLKKYIKRWDRIAVAFSSGVDSTFLLKAVKDTLGDNVIAITVCSDFFSKEETEETVQFCSDNNIEHIMVKCDVLSVSDIRENPVDRCYKCKKELFGNIIKVAKENNAQVVFEGSNLDDLGDYRPGMRAVKELGVKSPLLEVGFKKDDIRALSKEIGLGTWKKPSMACLASRFAYNQRITVEELTMVHNGEMMLKRNGFDQCRVRVDNHNASVEVLKEQLYRFENPEFKNKILNNILELGFKTVTINPEGYRTGSMNKNIV